MAIAFARIQGAQPMLDPKHDVVFKLLFAAPHNGDLLRSMIEAVVSLPRPIVSITVLNPEIPRAVASLKVVVLDICARLDDGTLIDIEMETSPRPALTSRLLYYWARMYAGQLDRGENYDRLRRAVSIVWLDGRAPVDGPPRFHSIFRVLETRTHAPLTGHLELHLLSLTAGVDSEAAVPLARWARFFLATDDAALQALAEESTVMSKAVKELERVSRDPETQRTLDEVELARRVYGHMVAEEREEAREEGMLAGLEKGLEKGLIAGREEAAVAIARKLRAAGAAMDLIAQATGLPVAVIEALS